MPADLKQASDSLAKTGRTLRRAQDAWATWRGAAQNAHIAAVMGYSLPRHSAYLICHREPSAYMYDLSERALCI